jgi:hypothetical protein
MSDEDRKQLKALGHKPEDVQAALKSKGMDEYNALTGKEA